MTDLTAKFSALEGTLGGKLDTIILRLDNISAALTSSGRNADIIAAIEAMRGAGTANTIAAANAVLNRLIAQFDTQAIVPTMKDLLMTISAQQAIIAQNTINPLVASPVGACQAPFTSAGTKYIPVSADVVEPMTAATWSEVPIGFNFNILEGNSIVYCADWSQYRIYVASNASQFGVWTETPQRFRTNEWVNLERDGYFEFFVNGNESLRVYICPVGAETDDGNPAPAQNACGNQWTRMLEWVSLDTITWSGTNYYAWRPQFDVEQLMLPRVELPDQMTGRSVYCQPDEGDGTMCLGWNLAEREGDYLVLTRSASWPISGGPFVPVSPLNFDAVNAIGEGGLQEPIRRLNEVLGYGDIVVEFIVLRSSPGEPQLDFFLAAAGDWPSS